MTAPRLTVPLFLLALLALALAVGAGGSAPSQAVQITATAAPWTILGSRVGINGSVEPHRAALELTLEVRQGGAWLPLATKTVSGGTFTFLAEPKDPGRTTFRVVTAGGGFTGSSSPVVVKVLHWTYLSDLYARPVAGDLLTDPNSSHGVTYDHAVSMDPGCYNAWNGDAWVDYILDRKYELFTATVGLDDAAADGATATYSVFGGGKILASGSLTNGTTKKIKVSVSDMYRVRLRINVPDPNNSAGCGINFTQVVFGDAQILGP